MKKLRLSWAWSEGPVWPGVIGTLGPVLAPEPLVASEDESGDAGINDSGAAEVTEMAEANNRVIGDETQLPELTCPPNLPATNMPLEGFTGVLQGSMHSKMIIKPRILNTSRCGAPAHKRGTKSP